MYVPGDSVRIPTMMYYRYDDLYFLRATSAPGSVKLPDPNNQIILLDMNLIWNAAGAKRLKYLHKRQCTILLRRMAFVIFYRLQCTTKKFLNTLVEFRTRLSKSVSTFPMECALPVGHQKQVAASRCKFYRPLVIIYGKVTRRQTAHNFNRDGFIACHLNSGTNTVVIYVGISLLRRL